MLNSVMVVDDESSIRSAVEQWLSLSGFEVQLFSRAEECLAQLPRHFPGVILSDVRMPGMSGLELLAEVQRRDADLPVILLTGHGDVPMAVDAMRDGAYDFLEKPFSPETLLGSLRRALDKRRLVLENRALHEQADNRAKLDATFSASKPSHDTDGMRTRAPRSATARGNPPWTESLSASVVDRDWGFAVGGSSNSVMEVILSRHRRKDEPWLNRRAHPR